MSAPDDFQTGDAKTDAKINSASDKVSRGEKLTTDEAMALGAGAVQAIGAAASVPGMGPIFLAMVAGELAFAAGLDWLFQKLGLHAGAGPGTCVTVGPPSGPNDPRWHSAAHGAALGPISASANSWEPSRLEFERVALTALSHAWELTQNCGPTIPLAPLLVRIADFWNATHAGPQTFYAPLSSGGGLGPGWGDWLPPFGEALPHDGLRVNTGAAIAPHQLSPLSRLNLDPRTYLYLISLYGNQWVNVDARWWPTNADALAMVDYTARQSAASVVAYLRGVYDSAYRTVQR